MTEATRPRRHRRHLLHDRDDKFGPGFDAVGQGEVRASFGLPCGRPMRRCRQAMGAHGGIGVQPTVLSSWMSDTSDECSIAPSATTTGMAPRRPGVASTVTAYDADAVEARDDSEASADTRPSAGPSTTITAHDRSGRVLGPYDAGRPCSARRAISARSDSGDSAPSPGGHQRWLDHVHKPRCDRMFVPLDLLAARYAAL